MSVRDGGAVMKRTVAVCALWYLLTGYSNGAEAQIRRGEVSFDRNDRVLTWKSGNSGEFGLTNKLGLKYDSTLTTSLSMTTGSAVEDRWYDTVYNSAELNYSLSDRTDLTFSASEDWNRDTMSRLGESLLTTNVDGGIRYRTRYGLTLNGGIGHIFDSRFENKDSGGRFKGGLSYTLEPFRNVRVSFDGTGETTNMKRSRDTYGGTGNISYKRRDTDFTLALSENFNRRGYFSDIDRTTVEKRNRREQNLLLGITKGDFNALRNAAAYEVNFNLGRKLIDDTANDDERSTKYKNNADGDEKGIGFRVGKSFARRVTANWGMDYSKVFNGVERLSRRRTQTVVGTEGSLFFGVTRVDSIEVAGMIKRTRIDTPVGIANDRDELKMEGGILYRRHFSDDFETALDFRVLETHYVNIDVSQSAQNKWMNTYLFSPSLVYSPFRAVRIEHTVNVYANYIEYDYDTDYSPRSNISRRLTSESWIDCSLSDKTLVRTGVMFEGNDYGMLNSSGDKLPAEEGIKRFVDMSVEYRFARWLVLVPNYIYAIRRDWSLSEDRTTTIRREVDQTYGLACRLFRNEHGGIDLSFRRIVRTTYKYPVRIRDYITLKLNYGF